MKKIFIEIKGGCLWAVRALDDRDPQIEIIVRDHDDIEDGDLDPLKDIDPQRLTTIY